MLADTGLTDAIGLFPGIQAGDEVFGTFRADTAGAVVSTSTGVAQYTLDSMHMTISVETAQGTFQVPVPAAAGGGSIEFDWTTDNYNFLAAEFANIPNAIGPTLIVTIDGQPNPFYQAGGPLLQNFAISDADGFGTFVEFIKPDSDESLFTAVDFTIDSLTYSTPEPASIVMVGLGLLGLACVRRRRT